MNRQNRKAPKLEITSSRILLPIKTCKTPTTKSTIRPENKLKQN